MKIDDNRVCRAQHGNLFGDSLQIFLLYRISDVEVFKKPRITNNPIRHHAYIPSSPVKVVEKKVVSN